MHFGRLDSVDDVDFSIPETHPLSGVVLAKAKPAESPKVYLGCPVWSRKEFVGKIYPPKTPAKKYLAEYCKQFNSIEVNATHYQTPSEKQIEGWKEAATEGFKFCPKFPQNITHRKEFYNKEDEIDRFLTAVYGLGEHLGPCLIQFPPYFKTDRMPQLETFLKKLPADLEYAVELRHETWYESETIKKEWFDLFQQYNVISNITDTAGRRDVLHQILTTDKAFIRFAGNDLHPTDFQRVDEWMLLFGEWIEAGVKEIYFFPHEPQKDLCADLMIYMVDRLNAKTGLNIKPPVDYREIELF